MQFKDYIQRMPAYKPPKIIGSLAADVVKLSSNENVIGPSPRAVAALQAGLGTIHRYPDSSAAMLRAALARRDSIDTDMILCGNGSDELILLLCLGFLREGDETVMAEGTFISYLMRTLEMGATPVRVPLRADYTHDLPALVDAITPRTRVLFVCNPNNPTGTTVGAADVEELLARVPDDVLVVMDEAYIEYTTRPDFPDLLPELRNGRGNLLLLRTFAKIYGLAGLRVGYGYGHPQIIDYLNRTRPVFSVNMLAQLAAVAALEDAEHVERSRVHAADSRAFFTRELAKLGLRVIPSETNFFIIEVGDDVAAADSLRERGFTVTPLKGWGVPGCIRISYGTMEENQRFVAALADALEEQPSPLSSD
jgi:histidinol-phosphate aminotransferase